MRIQRYDVFKPRSKATSLFPNLMLPLVLLLRRELLSLELDPFIAVTLVSSSKSLVDGDVLFNGSSPMITRTLSGKFGATAIN